MGDAKPPGAKASSKSKDKKTKTNDDAEDVPLVLTPSENALGIKITQPKQQTLDTMTRLYAVPSEKLRVWSCWLTKVGERADDWQWWLRAQIGLTLRISDYLQRAATTLESEKSTRLDQGDGKADDTTTPEQAETEIPATEVAESSIELKQGESETEEANEEEPEENPEPEEPKQEEEIDEEQTVQEEPKQEETKGEDVEEEPQPEESKSEDPEEEPKEEEAPTVEGENDDVVPEGGESGEAQQPVEVAESGKSQAEGDKTKGKKEKTVKGKGETVEPKIVYKEGFWPVGTRWKPLSQRGEPKPPHQRQPDEIPIPGNEGEMMKLVRQFRHQGVTYRSLYKHWCETADQAVKQIAGRTVLPTKEVYLNDEEIPYFFYLETEPDIDYAIEHDDEEVLLSDPDRERITHEFTHLYFNLCDKPGKGGKPWL